MTSLDVTDAAGDYLSCSAGLMVPGLGMPPIYGIALGVNSETPVILNRLQAEQLLHWLSQTLDTLPKWE